MATCPTRPPSKNHVEEVLRSAKVSAIKSVDWNKVDNSLIDKFFTLLEEEKNK